MSSFLFHPFLFLKIKHQELTRLRWHYPIGFALATVLIIHQSREYLIVFGENGLLSNILTFLQILPGFYIASLAAVATFNRPTIDQIIPNPPTLVYPGKSNPISLTRRRFLSLLFAYLTAMSFLLVVVCIFSQNLFLFVKDVSPLFLHVFIKNGFLFLFFVGFWQLTSGTLISLSYLGDRVLRSDTSPRSQFRDNGDEH